MPDAARDMGQLQSSSILIFGGLTAVICHLYPWMSTPPCVEQVEKQHDGRLLYVTADLQT
jgi:hypothetical protein